MKFTFVSPGVLTFLSYCFILQSCTPSDEINSQWETVSAIGEPTPRHEAGFVAYKDKLLLMGGRRINSTDEFSTKTNTWTAKSPTPVELHHFQPVVVDDAVYLLGAMTGTWPNEKPLDRVIIYYPARDEYVYGDTIPENRRRGGAGAVYYNNKLYLVGGITNGHMNGYKPWLDEYDPKTGEWKVLEDAPNARDHFQALVIGDKLYAFAGRTTSKKTNEDMALTARYGNVYDFTTEQWETVTSNLALPTLRAGNAAFAWGNEIIIGGGESIIQEAAHSEVEAYNSKAKTWRDWPSLQQGRHGTGFAVVGDYVYTASGSGNRGGGPELTSIERLKLPDQVRSAMDSKVVQVPIYSQWHTITLPFEGPVTSENATENPFLNYRLSVEFKHQDTLYTVRGFYAADGNSAETSADAGNIWQVRFTPDRLGEWSYEAVLHHGEDIALHNNLIQGSEIKIADATGNFIVTRSDKEGDDFRARGRLEAFNGYFRFRNSGKHWLKGGTDSPENLLAYADFDNTYRIQASADDGEASTTDQIHAYAPHKKDWKIGDPSWQNGKGKSLVGALNYLSSTGINGAYFLAMNILGDGKDVWPFVSPDDYTRFDVSKLAQWEIVFQHMQAKGILLHMVLQETENEMMFDNGNTGPMRQLYLLELIARFGHHLALNWNLGEENGPASFSPIGQNDKQRRDMTRFIKQNDPYRHPVLLHTHSSDPARSDILDQILGFEDLDGLSLQQSERKDAAEVVQTWKAKSIAAGREWIITMDEIGMWHTGALPDSLDPNHDTLRRYVLWGTLMSGAAGVEWYFGARTTHNDLTSEDWRQRDRLWQLTNHAIRFFEDYLPYWQMQPENELVNSKNNYCFRKPGEIYAVYLSEANQNTIDLSATKGKFSVQWFNPLTGGELLTGSVKTLSGGAIGTLGTPPAGSSSIDLKTQDWVVLIKKTN